MQILWTSWPLSNINFWYGNGYFALCVCLSFLLSSTRLLLGLTMRSMSGVFYETKTVYPSEASGFILICSGRSRVPRLFSFIVLFVVVLCLDWSLLNTFRFSLLLIIFLLLLWGAGGHGVFYWVLNFPNEYNSYPWGNGTRIVLTRPMIIKQWNYNTWRVWR